MFKGSVYVNQDKLETHELRSRRILFKPNIWGQEEGSYFGYAVSSGYFYSSSSANLLYVATAPHANNKSGEAYIFDYRDEGRTIHKHRVFQGEQFGEYFGYSVLAEDLNGEGRTDLIISAPQYALEGSFDNGAIYMFINKGYFNFARTIILSPLGSKGRFGSTLSRIGDINLDGYKAKMGCGSQRLDAPYHLASKYGAAMFGHGLSRGFDMDGNGFNDFVIGAPNAEVSFLFKAYPVVRVLARVEPTSQRIETEQEHLNITVCYGLDITFNINKVRPQEVDIGIGLDAEKSEIEKRAVFNGSSKIFFSSMAILEETCRNFEIQMVKKAKFENIALKMHYKLKKNIPESGEFCEDCALVDPAEPTFTTGYITFNTGCFTVDCVADLKLRSINVSAQNESHPEDNSLTTVITLREHTDIEAIG
ncbi:integrin alpha-PS4-like [Drosophila subpulchrella]|uniref:integrin alpha-PS4-like n=1 Tax=Drosophila subpulchrella TaxID=1486046 RepID=UPI0018A1898D|nr:integrin alpha-PS4-like [Drosophila subpulchrella]